MTTTNRPGMGLAKVLALLTFAAAGAATAAETPEEQLERHRRDVPCFSEYRDWVYGMRTPESFEVPSGLTVDQCAHAREVSERLGAVAVRSKADIARQLAEDQRQQAFKAEMDRLQAESDASRRKTEAEIRRLLASHARARAELARRPPATIGMTQQQVLETRWGKPQHRSRVTTATRKTETWYYDRGALQFIDGRLEAILEN